MVFERGNLVKIVITESFALKLTIKMYIGHAVIHPEFAGDNKHLIIRRCICVILTLCYIEYVFITFVLHILLTTIQM